ncbi:MAG: ATP-binding cassette domain-containing protein [Gammaproteobacteria bacterium]|nr:MAG: ATP-binding cassette domain-containing protein [Gammaproteobacteria bacterium]
MIELRALHKNYYVNKQPLPALKNINLTIRRGEIFGVLGKSGAGKSTLLRCINLLEKPTSGHVIVNNVELTTLSTKQLREHRHKIGMIFQHFNLLDSRTVFENVALPLEIIHQSKAAIQKKVSALLELVDLTERQHHLPSQLSGGQKQRVAIARALAADPHVLLCDEATSSLDPESTQSILNLLKKINREFGLTILLITHELDVVKQICDRVGVIEEGQLIEKVVR